MTAVKLRRSRLYTRLASGGSSLQRDRANRHRVVTALLKNLQRFRAVGLPPAVKAERAGGRPATLDASQLRRVPRSASPGSRGVGGGFLQWDCRRAQAQRAFQINPGFKESQIQSAGIVSGVPAHRRPGGPTVDRGEALRLLIQGEVALLWGFQRMFDFCKEDS